VITLVRTHATSRPHSRAVSAPHGADVVACIVDRAERVVPRAIGHCCSPHLYSWAVVVAERTWPRSLHVQLDEGRIRRRAAIQQDEGEGEDGGVHSGAHLHKLVRIRGKGR
jgi:hypothetical protein